MAKLRLECEVCGAPVVSIVRDMVEKTPVPDENGMLWRKMEYDGPPHFFCLEHDREPIGDDNERREPLAPA